MQLQQGRFSVAGFARRGARVHCSLLLRTDYTRFFRISSLVRISSHLASRMHRRAQPSKLDSDFLAERKSSSVHEVLSRAQSSISVSWRAGLHHGQDRRGGGGGGGAHPQPGRRERVGRRCGAPACAAAAANRRRRQVRTGRGQERRP
eukprot:3209583-Pleurochrysis_carterae.AAC.1